MSVGHLDHVLIVYSLMEHVTWKSSGPMCGWVGRILHPDSCTSVSSWSKMPLLSIWSVAVPLCRLLLPCPSRWHGSLPRHGLWRLTCELLYTALPCPGGSGLCTSCERVDFFLVFLDPQTVLPVCLSNIRAEQFCKAVSPVSSATFKRRRTVCFSCLLILTRAVTARRTFCITICFGISITLTNERMLLLYDPANKKSVCKKLKRRWTGPYYVTGEGGGYVYKLRRCDNGRELRAYIHANRLRPFTVSREL